MAVLDRAAKQAPAGRLMQDLAMLDADVRITIAEWGGEDGVLADEQVLADMGAVTADCRSVPSQ